jgi:hypothetical protein
MPGGDETIGAGQRGWSHVKPRIMLAFPLVALPAINPIQLLGLGSDIRLVVPSANPCSSLPSPYARAVRVPRTYQLPDVGAKATKIPSSDEPTIPRLVASPTIVPIHHFGPGSNLQ